MNQVCLTRTDEYTFECLNLQNHVRESVLIRFVNGKFDSCTYPFSGTYSYGEWMILGQIAAKIKELQEHYDKEV